MVSIRSRRWRKISQIISGAPKIPVMAPAGICIPSIGSSNKATLLVNSNNNAPSPNAVTKRLPMDEIPSALTKLAAPSPIKPISPTSLMTSAVTTATMTTTKARIPLIGTPKRLACESSKLISVSGFNKGRQAIAAKVAVIINARLLSQLLCAKNPAAHDNIPLLLSAKNNTNTLATAASKILTTRPASIRISGLKRLGADKANTKPILMMAPTKAT